MNNVKAEERESVFTVFLVFLRLGLTSFGGPVAHIGYFHNEFVERRKWLNERAYADLVALCQFLPGPASSQIGIGLGLSRAGLMGAVAAWFAFTMPSALALILFGFWVAEFGDEVAVFCCSCHLLIAALSRRHQRFPIFVLLQGCH